MSSLIPYIKKYTPKGQVMIPYREFEVLLSELESRAQVCGISTDEMVVLVGNWPICSRENEVATEAAARRLYELLGLARQLFGNDAQDWFRVPNAGLDGMSPMSILLEDRRTIAALRNILRCEIDEC